MTAEPSPNPKEPHVLRVGEKLGAYEIVSLLGSGGMGLIYQARDTKLGRLVALKFLRGSDRSGDSASARLLQEAKNASALNHPYIATVYEVGESDGRAYIAMEFVEGRSLSAVLERDSLAPETAVRYGLEIAAALAHAHERGIVHRDLKPANVMITSAGTVKVLDFGLAKRLPGPDLSAATVSKAPISQEAGIVGTLLYMAPETLRGEQADARTDLWALGAVLYEMVIGRPPFEGGTAYETSTAILREPPKSFPPFVPLRLQAVIQRCLAKEREHRYQRASEVHAALETIGADVVGAAPAASSSGTQVPLPPRSSLKALLIAGAAIALVAAALGSHWLLRSKPASLPPSSAEWVQLTDFADSATSPALSPDGKMLAFIHGPSTFFGQGEIDAKVLPNGDPVELTRDGTMKMSPEFSPDGSTIAYTVYTASDWDTWSVPVLGGDTRKIFTNAEGLTWIDADHLLFSQIISGTHMSVVTAGGSGSPRRDIYVPPRERGMAHRSAISPDRKSVLVAGMDNGGWLPCRLVPFEGGSAGKIVGPADAACTHVSWSPDGKWMYVNSESGGRFHIWRQRYPDGDPEQVTSGATEEEGIAVAPDGKSLITSVGLRERTIWVQDVKGEHQLSTQGFAESPHFSHDGKKLYYLVRRHGLSGQFVSGELWVADLASNRSERALPGFEVTGFDVSADGKEAVFSATDKDNVPNLWLASLDLQFSPRRFASPVSEDQPHFDGAGNIYFRASEGNQNFIYRMKVDGSDRQKAYPDPILEVHSISPDGKSASVWAQLEGTETHNFAVSLKGGHPVTLCTGYCGGQWSVDGRIFFLNAYAMDGLYTMLASVPSGGLPPLPAGGVQTHADMVRVKGAKIFEGILVPGPLPGQTATEREEVHRNLYRIPLQ
ncbi:MAG TPA: protein kinase [Candidatus Acidoferrales bacterium]|nr:protein kinase [Candidatus Acidoferrales bacterium]